MDPYVHVDVMGPASVHGTAAPFHRSAAFELVVYLAFHREGVRHAECALALWPERPVSASTVHSTASDARRALGHAADGTAHLPRGVRLRLGETVRTDVERFAALAASGAPWDLVQAMQLVRGPLFGGLRRADWAVLDGTAAVVEGLVVRTALCGARLLERNGDAATAEQMVRRALTLSPYDERLYRALLRATAAQGDRARLRPTLADLCTLAGDPARGTGSSAGPDAAAVLHPETTDLYRDLRRGRPDTGGRPARL